MSRVVLKAVGLTFLFLVLPFLGAGRVNAQTTYTLRPELSWQRSTESPVGIVTETAVGQRVNDALLLPLDPNQTVFDNGIFTPLVNKNVVPAGNNWSSWPQYSAGFTCGSIFELRHFQVKFNLGVNPASIQSFKLKSPYYSGNVFPINDNAYIFLNGTRIATLGTSYGATNIGTRGTAAFANETDGWYGNGDFGNGPVSYLVSGENVIDIVAGEWCLWGGMGRLELVLEVSQTRLTDEELAKMYSPVFYIDSNDYFPRTVEMMMDNGTLNYEEGNLSGFIKPPLTSSNLYDHKDTRKNYIDLPPKIEENVQQKQDYQNLVATGNYPVTVYSRVVEDSDHMVIQYWFFSYYNDFWNKHEGDWEMIEVVLDQNQKPEFAAYAQHNGGTRRNWPDLIKDEIEGSKTHPRVYVATGSHASYFQFKGDGYDPSIVPFDRDDQVVTTKLTQPIDLIVLPEKDGATAENFGWLGYEGYWGEYSRRLELRSPRGPAEKDRKSWSEPYEWGNDLDDDIKKWGFTKVAVYSPVDLNFYDSNGNVVSKSTSQIPGAEYLIDEESDQKSIIVPAGNSQGQFKVVLEGTGNGMFDLDIFTTDLGSNTSYQVNYFDVPVTLSTIGQIIVDQNHNFILELDNQNDGVFETTVLPSNITQELFDSIQPVVLANVSGTKGEDNWYRSDVTIELSANDNETGVDKIMYDLGDGLKEYEGPIIFTSEGINFLQYLAIDNFGNSSKIGLLEINIDKTAPEAKVFVDQDSQDLIVEIIDFNPFSVEGFENSQTKKKDDTIYVITDMAGNTLELDVRDRDKEKKDRFKIYSLTYNSGQPVIQPDNYFNVSYQDEEDKKNLKEQNFEIKGEIKIRIKYDAKRNKSTTITKEAGQEKVKEVKDGLVLLQLQTNQANLEFGY